MKLNLSQTDIEKICHPFFSCIEKHKFEVYLTKGGNIAIILNKCAGGTSPFLGAYFTGSSNEDGEWIPCKWDSNGYYPSINEKMKSTKLDLIIPKQNKDDIVA